MRRPPNIKRLTDNQRSLLQKMAGGLVVRVIKDHDKEPVIELQSESGMKKYGSVSFKLMKSLGKRRVFTYFGWMPSLFVTIDTYSLKKEVVEKLKQ